MQVCTSFQTDNHASTPLATTQVFYRLDALPAAQPTNSVKALKATTLPCEIQKNT